MGDGFEEMEPNHQDHHWEYIPDKAGRFQRCSYCGIHADWAYYEFYLKKQGPPLNECPPCKPNLRGLTRKIEERLNGIEAED